MFLLHIIFSYLVNYSTDTAGEEDILSKSQVETVEAYVGKVVGIREMLSRDRMKVAFFGR